SQAVLIKAPTAPEAGLQHLLDSIVERMAGVVSSQGAKYVMLNAPRAALDRITAILPGAGSPTVMPLSGRDDAVAVHAVCQEAVFCDTLEKLNAAGASAIPGLPTEALLCGSRLTGTPWIQRAASKPWPVRANGPRRGSRTRCARFWTMCVRAAVRRSRTGASSLTGPRLGVWL